MKNILFSLLIVALPLNHCVAVEQQADTAIQTNASADNTLETTLAEEPTRRVRTEHPVITHLRKHRLAYMALGAAGLTVAAAVVRQLMQSPQAVSAHQEEAPLVSTAQFHTCVTNGVTHLLTVPEGFFPAAPETPATPSITPYRIAKTRDLAFKQAIRSMGHVSQAQWLHVAESLQPADRVQLIEYIAHARPSQLRALFAQANRASQTTHRRPHATQESSVASPTNHTTPRLRTLQAITDPQARRTLIERTLAQDLQLAAESGVKAAPHTFGPDLPSACDAIAERMVDPAAPSPEQATAMVLHPLMAQRLTHAAITHALREEGVTQLAHQQWVRDLALRFYSTSQQPQRRTLATTPVVRHQAPSRVTRLALCDGRVDAPPAPAALAQTATHVSPATPPTPADNASTATEETLARVQGPQALLASHGQQAPPPSPTDETPSFETASFVTADSTTPPSAAPASADDTSRTPLTVEQMSATVGAVRPHAPAILREAQTSASMSTTTQPTPVEERHLNARQRAILQRNSLLAKAAPLASPRALTHVETPADTSATAPAPHAHVETARDTAAAGKSAVVLEIEAQLEKALTRHDKLKILTKAYEAGQITIQKLQQLTKSASSFSFKPRLL